MAKDAAWDAAWAMAKATAWDAARDAELYVLATHVCAGLPLDEQHRQHAADRWQVWQKGYALYGDVDEVLYVYAADDPQ
jgi:hypothetical protein